MADASNSIRHRVLHIRSKPPASPDAGPHRSLIDELLAGLPLETEWCGDVYRGLAGLLRPSSDPPQAAIVCLDGLGTPEYEFFSILSKLRRDLNVYVYAAARAESRIARAVERGAKGPVTREVLKELAGDPSVGATMTLPTRTPEPHDDTDVAPTNPPALPDPPGTEAGARKPARVPWLRYADRPARVAPPQREPSPRALKPKPQAPNPQRSFEPLLTEEELRALMSDDSAAIAPDDPRTRRPVDDGQIRGVS